MSNEPTENNQRGSEMAKSYGIKILVMNNGDEVIANVEEFDSKKVTIHYPMKLVTESTLKSDNTVSYKISFRSWMKHTPQQHFNIPKTMYSFMVDPYDDISKQYIDIVRKLPREDKNYINMEEILESYNSPKGIGQGSVHDGMRVPTQAELDKAINYIEQCGFAIIDAADIMDAEVDDSDYDGVEEDTDEDYNSSDEEGWNPHDRWSE